MAQVNPEMLHDDVAGIARAADLLRAGALIGLPTETVYGLAADAGNARAVAAIFAAKGRPTFNPLIVHVASLEAADEIALIDARAQELAQAFWPGALTLVLPSRGRVADLVTGGLDTIAIRVPAHPVARKVLAAFGGPIAAPSANPSGQISPTRASHVAAGLGHKVAAIVDGGPCDVGVESTILATGGSDVRLLREGGIARERIEAVLGTALVADLTPGRVEAPGQMERHYATQAPLMIGGELQPQEVSLGFGDMDADLNLSASGDLIEAAANLFDMLHRADALAATRGARTIRVAEIPNHGLGAAINDRLTRASVRTTSQM